MQIVLNDVPTKKVPFMMSMFNNLAFVAPGSAIMRSEKEVFLDELEESVKEVREHIHGRKKLKTLREFLSEV